MEMHQVRYFLAVARERNFTRAAESCHVTQPSLTRAIQKLEEEFGGELFRRERALTHLTDLGRLMLPLLERTYESAQQARALARQVGRAEVAPLAVGLASDVHLPGLPLLFGALDRAFAGFDLSLRSGEAPALLDAALAGDLDAVIADLGRDLPERVDCWDLRQERYGLLLRDDHQLATSPNLALTALEGLTVIGLGAGLEAWQRGLLPPAVHITHRAGSQAAAALLVDAGLGIALLPEGGPTPAGTIWRAVEGLTAARTVALAVVAGRRRSGAADAFVKSVRARGWADAARAATG